MQVVCTNDLTALAPLGVMVYTLTHLPLDKIAVISKTIFFYAFSWMKNFVFGLKLDTSLFLMVQLQTCQPLRILRNHYAFRVSNTPLRKPVQNVGKLRILRNFGTIRPIPRNLQQLSRLAVSRKSPAGQNIDKELFILRLPSASSSNFAIRSTKEASCSGETMPNET